MKLYVNSFCTFVVMVISFSFVVLQSFAHVAKHTRTPAQAPIKKSLPSVAETKSPDVVTSSGNKSDESKSYREWKSQMVFEAESRVKATSNLLLVRVNQKNKTNKDPNLKYQPDSASGLNQKLQALLEQEQFQLAMAKDLTITDYFVGYLSKQKNPARIIKEVSTRLSSDEVAELMSAYANNFFTTQAPEKKEASRADSAQ